MILEKVKIELYHFSWKNGESFVQLFTIINFKERLIIWDVILLKNYILSQMNEYIIHMELINKQEQWSIMQHKILKRKKLLLNNWHFFTILWTSLKIKLLFKKITITFSTFLIAKSYWLVILVIISEEVVCIRYLQKLEWKSTKNLWKWL